MTSVGVAGAKGRTWEAALSGLWSVPAQPQSCCYRHVWSVTPRATSEGRCRVTPRVLVTYGTTDGGTRHIAEVVAGQLRHDGLTVDVAPALEINDVESYDAVVLGGAVFDSHWHDDARRFARRHAVALQHRPVWLFSAVGSGEPQPAGPVRGALQTMVRLHARAHETFSTDVPSMRAWADTIAHSLPATAPH